ncbi:MAG: hypothetical protein HN392_06160 [Anaerolineae bacterium]|nr:hypothetical protein [Anaerolineae bacterium]MBT7075847.1 hypothetical protein [Anaerolineae bacterium]MBT7782170.1 hypothetical protein [Anaerolineae bacterium]
MKAEGEIKPRTILAVFILSMIISACVDQQATPSVIMVTETQTWISNLKTPISKFTLSPATPFPTILPVATEVFLTQKLCHEPTRYTEYAVKYSPDRQWTAVVCEDDESYTKVAHISEVTEWIIPAVFNTLESGGLWGPELAIPFLWSKNGNYLYLSHYLCCIDSPELIFVEAHSLDRMNLITGEVEPWYQGSSFSFSPDERYFVYVSTATNKIDTVYIRELDSETAFRINLPQTYIDVGRFEWSPDGKSLVFIAGLDGWLWSEGGFSLFVYDLSNRSVREIIKNDMRYLGSPETYNLENPWFDDNHIILDDICSEYGYAVSNSDFWLLDIDTGELVSYVLPSDE